MIQDTICAIATAQGGAIGSIRVSGPEAISITGSIFKPAKAGKLLSEQKPYTLTERFILFFDSRILAFAEEVG